MNSQIRLYLSIVKIGFLEFLAYRLNLMIGLLRYIMTIAAYSYLYIAAFQGMGGVWGYSLADLLTYVAVGWFMRVLYHTKIDETIGHRVRLGHISLDLLKPVNFPLFYLSYAFGQSLNRVIAILLPLLLLSFPFLPLQSLPSLKVFSLFMVSLSFGYLTIFLIKYLVGLSAFFFEFNDEISWTVDMTTNLLAGLVIPLHFFPSLIYAMLGYLPFQGVYFVPLQIYLGKLEGMALKSALEVQFFWILLLSALSLFVYQKGIQRLTIQGG